MGNRARGRRAGLVAGLRLGPGRRRPASRRAVDLGSSTACRARPAEPSPTCPRTAGWSCSARATARWCRPTSPTAPRIARPRSIASIATPTATGSSTNRRGGHSWRWSRRSTPGWSTSVSRSPATLPRGRRRSTPTAARSRSSPTPPTCCRAGAPEVVASNDGDLLVAEFHLGQIRRVLDGSDTTGVPGAHGNPALSKTGQVIAFDTMAASAIAGTQPSALDTGRSVVSVEAVPQPVAGGARLRHGVARLREHRVLRQGAQLRAGQLRAGGSRIVVARTSRSRAAPAAGGSSSPPATRARST